MTERFPMTRVGYKKLRAELDHMENVEMPEIEKRIGIARSEGDLGENAEFHGARESQGMLQARINVIRDKLARGELIDPAKLPRDRVVFGASVTVRDLDLDDEEQFTLVGAGEDNPDEGKILVTSPLAQGLLGKKVGQKVDIEVPAGVLKFEILEIRFDEA